MPTFISYLERLSRPAFWLCVAALFYLSLVPGTLRPHTGASGHAEHFMAYAGTAALFVPQARGKLSRLAAAIGLAWLSGGLEIAQLWIPGRSGEVAGLIWSSAGACLGLLAGQVIWLGLQPKAE